MSSMVIPIVKCKSGDMTDVNNYRAIAISTALSKLFKYATLNSRRTAKNAIVRSNVVVRSERPGTSQSAANSEVYN